MLHSLKWSYIFKHWIGTLLLGTTLLTISPGSNPLNSSGIGTTMLFLILWFWYSSLYSIPTLACYILAFCWFKNNTLNVNWIKMTLILITLAGITMTVGLTVQSIESAIYYSIAAIITGILFKIELLSTCSKNHTTLD
ncbi:hypothetical protein [Sphingobacterium sp. Ag1]|uniref:hypothetical protein n=1 Tax=Sphingobacterium sp. Ag1 TaxID=1643451 RepID=UPI000627774C|nr:hypothetical protein [Sphingobacterium sp. Ag1]